MARAQSFREILEGIDTLSLQDQEILEQILHRRIIERRREELAQDVQQARKEFHTGQISPVTPDELMDEIMP